MKYETDDYIIEYVLSKQNQKQKSSSKKQKANLAHK